MTSTQRVDVLSAPLHNLRRSFAGRRIQRERRQTSSFVYGFGVDSSALMPEHTDVLQPQIAFLREHPESTVISVVGRASQTGPEANNRQLARDRAERVRAYLVASGVPDDRVGPTVFHGSEAPLIDVPGQEAAVNRSVELLIDWTLEIGDAVAAPGTGLDWKLDLTVTFGAGFGLGGQMQIGTLTNRDTGEHHAATANILGLDLGQSLFLTAAADVGLPVGTDGEFSMPEPPGPVGFDWFDGRFIVLTSVGASAIVGGVDIATVRFRNSEGEWPEASFFDYPIGLTVGIGGLAMIGFLNVDL